MISKKINLLLTGAGTATFGNVLKALKAQSEINFKIIACDIDPTAYGLHLADNYYLVPKASDPTFITSVVDICSKEKIDIFLPLLSLEYGIISSSIDKFEKKGIIIPISEQETIKICSDKLLTYDLFVKNNIHTPFSFLPDQVPSNLNFPLIIKPRVMSGSKYIFKVNSRDDLARNIPNVPNPIIQEYIEGIEYTIDVLADREYKDIAIVPRVRLDIMDGKSAKGMTVNDETLINYSRKIISLAKIYGAANIQCIKNKHGYFFTEINPRFSAGGLPLTIQAGANTPLLLMKMAIGEKINPVKKFQDRVIMLRYFDEIFLNADNLTNFSPISNL